jgi:hypothetical protein
MDETAETGSYCAYNLRCTINVPDRSTVWGDNGLGGQSAQSEDSKCVNEYTRLFGPDALPSLGMMKYGGMYSLAEHFQCLHCYDKAGVMGDECSPKFAAGEVNTKVEANFADQNTTLAFSLSQDLCDYFHAHVRNHPGDNLGDAFAASFAERSLWSEFSDLVGVPVDELIRLWTGAPAPTFFQKIAVESGWNGCRSMRFIDPVRNPSLENNATPPVINKFSPWPMVQMQLHGVPSTNYEAFGGAAPEVTLRDRNPSGLWEWEPLKLSTFLFSDGVSWMLYNTKLERGGSHRELDLELLIDGVPLGQATDSWWKFDTPGTIHNVRSHPNLLA